MHSCPLIKRPRKGQIFVHSFIKAFLFFSIVLNMSLLTKSFAASVTKTSRADWNNGIMDGTESESKEGNLNLKSTGTWGPLVWRTPNLSLSAGTPMTSDGTYIYLIPNGSAAFARYIPSQNSWEELARAPRAVDQGSGMTFLGDYVYAIFGNYQKEFARYSKSTNTWENLADLPDLVYAGASVSTDGTYIYVLRGAGTSDFWRYDISDDSWTVLTNTPATISNGASMVYSGGFFYTPRGGSVNTFYRYSVAAGTWSSMTNATFTFGNVTHLVLKSGYIYGLQDAATSTFARYNISGNSWESLATTPQVTRYVGVEYVSDDDQLYVFRGNGTYDFWKYDPASNSFMGPADMPAGPSTGADLVAYGGDLYGPRGGNTTTFYKYTRATNVWSTLTAAPAAFNDDTKGVAAGAYIYFFLGSNTTTFYRYNVVGNAWETLTVAPATTRFGASLAYPGTGDYIYATRGASTRSFYRYSISGNSWDDASVADLPDDADASYGARLISDGTDVYYISGSQTGQLLKYTVGTNTWSSLSNLPFAPFYGTDVTYYSGKLYIMAGYYKRDIYEYTIATAVWRYLDPVTEYYGYNAGVYIGGSIESDGAGNLFATFGNSVLNMSKYVIDASGYAVSGTWTGATIDLTYVSSWTSLTAATLTPDDSSITFQTRSSSDQTTWSAWQSLSGTDIVSSANRYLQVRATLNASSDRASAPVLYSYTVTYTGDEVDPTNPTTFSGQSQQVGGVSLSSGSTYNYNYPYFTWSGATDGASGLAGYYVYFGTNATADPETDGSYQTSSTYIATEALSAGTYYLRVKTKDAVGNVSGATAGFTYVYSGIATTSFAVTASADFTQGTLTNVDGSGDSIKLQSKAGFWESQRISLTPAAIYNGAGLAYVSSLNKLYTFRGNNTSTFYSYDLTNDTWATLATTPSAVNYGGDLVEGPSGYLYGFKGIDTTVFWQYDISGNTWDDAAAADAPQSISYGSSLEYDGSRYIYALRGNSDDAFYRYDTLNNVWASLTSVDFGSPTGQVNNLVYAGGDLAYDGDDNVYAIQGNTRTGFSKYSINTGDWTVIDNLPMYPYEGAQIEYDAATDSIYYLPSNGKTYFYRYDIASSTWYTLSDGPATFSYGASMRLVDDQLYVLRGNNTTNMYVYDITKARWLVPTRNLFGDLYLGSYLRSFSTGADIIKGDGNYFYIMRGNYDNQFIRYDSTTGEVVRLTGIPSGMFTGSTTSYDSVNGKIYVIPSQYNRKLFTYTIASDTWAEVTTDPPPLDPAAGSSLVYDGSRYFYWIRGGNTQSFYRYDTQADAGSRWVARTNVTAAVGGGAELVYKNGFIYTLRGNGTANNPFYRYDASDNTWAALTSLTVPVTTDGFLVDSGGDYLYACIGGNLATCYRYSVAGGTWSAITNAPAQINSGGAAASNGSNKIYVIAGAGTNTYNDGLFTYITQTSSSSFEESGTYASETHDLTAVYRFADLAVTYTSATNATLTAYTRTSSDGTTWSTWDLASEVKTVGTSYKYKINSTANRYIQVKFELTSADGINSGTVSDYTVNYYLDNTAPTNPTSLSSYSDAGMGTLITTANWYSNTAPYFSWPEAEAVGGASDTATGSGVLGYYVYFDTTVDADPETLGTYTVSPNYTGSGLVSGSTYYLRIKTIDDAGLVSTLTWVPFTYKYDSDAPSAPAGLAADPSGYSATDSFDFSWSVSTDGGAGGITYCYKTGASSGAFSTDQCTASTSVSDVPSYKTGVNTFYIRSKDASGNYSAYVTASYYYSSTAPSAPQNLDVTPSESTENLFAFSWDAPSTYFGSEAGLTYYYSINALPTSSSTTSTKSKLLAADAFATLPGANTLYITTKDEAGNIDWDIYESITFTANTVAPGIPTNVDIADVSVKSTSSWKLAISWEEPTSLGSGVGVYKVYRSDDDVTFTYLASTAGISYVDTRLLQQNYYYKVQACDSANNCGAFSASVTMYPTGKYTEEAPLIGEPVVSEITTKKATITWTTSRTADSKIAFGTSEGDYLDEEVGSSTQETEHVIALTNLSPGTTYYFVAKWADEDGNLGISTEYSFDTVAAPSAKEVLVLNAGLNSVDIQFTSKNASKAKVYYGLSADFGSVKETSVGTAESTYLVRLDNLTDGSKYYYKISLFDEESAEYEGDIYSFETLPRPKIENISVLQVKGTAQPSIFVTWSSNTEISSIVSYYPKNKETQSLDSVNVTLEKGRHRMLIKGLLPEIDYDLYISGRDKAGNEAKSTVVSIKTASDTRPPLVESLRVEGSVISLTGGQSKDKQAQLTISWDTDEPSTSQVEFGEGSGSVYSQKTQEDTNMTFNHVVVISGLSPSKVYHLRVLSKDKAANTGKSIDSVIITPKATDDALNLVISSLSQVFGFLQQVK